MQESQLLGLGECRASREVSSAEAGRLVGHDEHWVRARSGIQSRRYAEETETLTMMGVAAAEKALAEAAVDASSIDCVLVATSTNLLQMPQLAPTVAHRLGADRAAGFDLAAACAGFTHALAVARSLIGSGTARYVLIVAADRMTDIVDVADPSLGFLFGDGAGAVVVGPAATEWGIGPVVWGASGAQAEVLEMTATWAEYASSTRMSRPVLRMDGKSLARWVRGDVLPALRRAVESAQVDWSRISAFIPHQANLRIVDMLASSLPLPENAVVARDVVTAGNTSAASIPLAMRSLLDSGKAVSGNLALVGGYGAGLSFSAMVLRLP
ncbi:ketoacyl-ACP synthase III [Streptomyces sp. NPDC001514]